MRMFLENNSIQSLALRRYPSPVLARIIQYVEGPPRHNNKKKKAKEGKLSLLLKQGYPFSPARGYQNPWCFLGGS
jgi:hypothetical protein